MTTYYINYLSVNFGKFDVFCRGHDDTARVVDDSADWNSGKKRSAHRCSGRVQRVDDRMLESALGG